MIGLGWGRVGWGGQCCKISIYDDMMSPNITKEAIQLLDSHFSGLNQMLSMFQVSKSCI